MDIDILLALQEFKNGAGACLVDFMTKLSFIGEMKTVLIILIQKKIKKEKSLNVITDELESDEVEIRPLYEAVFKYGVDADPKDILEKMNVEAEA